MKQGGIPEQCRRHGAEFNNVAKRKLKRHVR